MKVAVIMGSKSDYPKLEEGIKLLERFGVEVSVRALSAHRTPKQLVSFLEEIENDTDVIIGAAGKAAHLPGVIASQTTMPVIGVPCKGAIEGLDALFSIVQMPKSIPVATVGINNAYNAGMLAVQMLAVGDKELKAKLGPVGLVLHGGTGVSDEDMKRCVREGMKKINEVTALNKNYIEVVSKTFTADDVTPLTSLRNLLGPANERIKEIVIDKASLFKL